MLNAAGVDIDGLGTFCFGLAFLFIGAVRAFSGGGIGWQLWFGGLLALIGGVNMASPDVGGLHPADRHHRAGRDPDLVGEPQPPSLTVATVSRAATRGRETAATTSTIRPNSSSVTMNGGPSRIVSPFVPSALPVPE